MPRERYAITNASWATSSASERSPRTRAQAATTDGAFPLDESAEGVAVAGEHGLDDRAVIVRCSGIQCDVLGPVRGHVLRAAGCGPPERAAPAGAVRASDDIIADDGVSHRRTEVMVLVTGWT